MTLYIHSYHFLKKIYSYKSISHLSNTIYAILNNFGFLLASYKFQIFSEINDYGLFILY